MSNRPLFIPEDVAAYSLNALLRTQKNYASWTEGWLLCKAPEYLLTVYVAEAIYKKYGRGAVSLEAPVQYLRYWAWEGGERRGGNFKRSNGRCDVVLWNRNNKHRPEGIIEIKSNSSRKGITRDIERICKLLSRKTNSLRFGLVVYYYSYHEMSGSRKTGREGILGYNNGLEKDCEIFKRNHQIKYFNKNIWFNRAEKVAWTVGAILIKR